MFAAFRLGAVWVPTNFRLMPDEVAYLAAASGAKAFLCHVDFPDHAAVRRQARRSQFIWRIGGQARLWRDTRLLRRSRRTPDANVGNAAVEYDDPCWFFFTSGTTGRSKAAVLDPRPDGLRHHQPSRRPDARRHRAGRLAGGRAAVAWRRRAPAGADRARRARTVLLPSEKFDIDGGLRLIERHRVSNMFTVPTILKMMVEHPAVDQLRPFLAAPRDLCRRADVSRGPEGGAEEARQGAGAVFRPRRGHRQHHRAAARPARARGRTARADRHLRLRAHRACRSRSRTTTAAN